MSHVRSVSIGLWVDVGSRDEPEDVAGASHFLEHMLFKGTPSRDAQEIANVFDAVGGEVNAYSAREHTCFYARVLDTDLDMAVRTLGDMFANAALRTDEIESERRVVLEEIHMANDVPEDIVHEVFSAAAWPSHALGRPVLGFDRTVGSMSADAIRGFYRQGYVPERLVVAAAGNITHDEVAAIVREVFTEGGDRWIRASPNTPRFGSGATYDTRDAEQVHIVWGLEGLPRTDPDRYAMSVMSVLYGGGMSSRLFQEVREKRGLAYSIYSGEHMYLDAGSLTVYAGAQRDTAAEVMKIVREEAA
ncbi:MAG: pitrilysin family protein, partial [Actinomycetota bacterium]